MSHDTLSLWNNHLRYNIYSRYNRILFYTILNKKYIYIKLVLFFFMEKLIYEKSSFKCCQILFKSSHVIRKYLYVIIIYFNINFAPEHRHHSVLPRLCRLRTSSVDKKYLECLRYAVSSYSFKSAMSLYRGLQKWC